MPTYFFRARTATGERRKGVVEGTSEEAILRHLESLQLVPVALQRQTDSGTTRESLVPLFARSRVGLKDLVLFARQLQTAVDAGVSLTAGLGILAEQAENQALKEAVLFVKQQIESGSSLAEALAKQPRVFPSIVVNMLKAGEESGLLSDMLDRTAFLLEHEMESATRIRSAVFYPVLVVGEMILAVFILMKFVLPKFAAFFSRFETELPLPTRILISVGTFTDKNWHVAMASIGALVVVLMLVLRTKSGLYQLDRLKLRMPILGPMVLKSTMSRFAHVLSALVRSGLPITQSLDVVRGVVGNRLVEKEVEKMKDAVVAGRSLAADLRDGTIFTPLVVKMIAVGEETGSLETMLRKVSDYYDRDLEYAVKNLATVIEPVLLVVLGAGVLFVALSIFLPMWNLMTAFKH